MEPIPKFKRPIHDSELLSQHPISLLQNQKSPLSQFADFFVGKKVRRDQISAIDGSIYIIRKR